MNAETARSALSLLEQGEDFALVTILGTQGSSPRHAGASMLVRVDGSIVGTVGGGPLEGSVIERAIEVMQSGETCLEHFDSALLGMACGGAELVLVDRIQAGDPTAMEFFGALAGLLEGGGRGWSVTRVIEGDDGRVSVRRCLVDSAGSIAGDAFAEREGLSELARRGGTYDRIVAGDPARTFVRPVGAQGTAYIFGAGHCGQKLAPVLSGLGFFTVVVDDRPDFAARERFPTADRIVVPESFDGVVETLPIDDDSYVVIVTRGHAHDQKVLAQALRTKARYIGMIGSKTKVAACFRALADEGYTSADIARVHAPIGLSIGAETPEEIAISIAAQLVQVRAAREG